MKRIALIFFLAIIALTGVVIASRFALKRERIEKTTISLTPVTLALDWTPNTNHTGIYVALAKGWYHLQGIDLHILPYSESVTPDVLVSSGKADFGISSTESVVGNRAAGLDITSVATILQHNTSSLAVLADSPIETPEDLDGKIYGGFGAPSEEAVVNAIIRHNGGQGTVKNIVLSTDAMQALQTQKVNVVWIYDGWEGIEAQLEGLKLRTFPITKNGIDDYYTPVLITSRKGIDEKRDVYKKFMAATEKGYLYAAKHPDEAARILIAQNPKGTFPDTKLVMKSQEFLSPYYPDTNGKWGTQTLAKWSGYPSFLLQAKAILDAKGKPVQSLDFKSFFTNELLN